MRRAAVFVFVSVGTCRVLILLSLCSCVGIVAGEGLGGRGRMWRGRVGWRGGKGRVGGSGAGGLGGACLRVGECTIHRQGLGLGGQYCKGCSCQLWHGSVVEARAFSRMSICT